MILCRANKHETELDRFGGLLTGPGQAQRPPRGPGQAQRWEEA
jgi:hypothetical protein